MKKFLLIIILVIVASCGAFALTSCGDKNKTSEEHAHVFDSFEIIKEATCTLDGERTGVCTVCGKTITEKIAALGHDNNVVIAAVPAGCEAVGWTEGRSCSHCGEIIVAPEAIPAVGHTFYYEKRSNDTHAKYCENCNYSEIADCEFEEMEIAPKCLESGTRY